jgi:hypothetical protein
MFRRIQEFYRRRKLVALFLTSVSFFLFFWVAIYALRNFSPGGSIDSQINTILLFTLIVSIATYLVFVGLRFKVDLFYAITLGVLVAYLSTSLMLINVDRSRSFYVLSWINEYDFPAVEAQRTYHLVRSSEILAVIPINQRIAEQEQRGFVTSQGGKLELTLKGKAALITADLLAASFRLQGWYKNKY